MEKDSWEFHINFNTLDLYTDMKSLIILHAEISHKKKWKAISSLGRYVFGSEISYNKAPPRLPGLGC